MAGQGKVSELKIKTRVLSANTSVFKGWTYHITNNSTITLPDTATLVAGDWVKFTRKIGQSPIIQTHTGSIVIKMVKQVDYTVVTDTSVTFDIESEIICVWNGVEWDL